MLYSFKIVFSLFFLFTLLGACSKKTKHQYVEADSIEKESLKPVETQALNNSKDKLDSLHMKVFKVSEGWGYSIYKDTALYVYQPHIPAISSNKAFESSTDAEIVAQLVVSKIKRKVLPPSISVQELDSLGVLN